MVLINSKTKLPRTLPTFKNNHKQNITVHYIKTEVPRTQPTFKVFYFRFLITSI